MSDVSRFQKLSLFSLVKALAVILLALSLNADAGSHCSKIIIPIGEHVTNAHQAIAHDLFRGQVVEMRPFQKDGNLQTLFYVKFQSFDPFTGQVRFREALFKPRLPGDGDGWARAPMEYAAYFLNRKLGMDYVPPVSYRRFLNLNWGDRHFEEGAFIYFAPEFRALANLPGESFGELHEAFVSDSRILNVLLQNIDAHNRNMGIARHWVDGKMRPAFIDFGASMRRQTNVSMTNFNVFGNNSVVKKVRRSTFENLKRLKHYHFHSLIFDNLMNDAEAWKILGTRDGIVNYFQRLIDERGAQRVIIEE